MPSWPARLLLSGLPASESANPLPLEPSATDGAHRLQNPSRQNVVRSAQRASVSDSRNSDSFSPTTTSPSRKALQHGRSISHPFPSALASGKRVDRNTDHGLQEPAMNMVIRANAPGMDKQHVGSPGQKGASHYSEGDLVTGRCATCDSLVRWPRQLNVYRCSVCLMINDLKPMVWEDGPASNPQGAERISSVPGTTRVLPMSLSKVHSLIDQCIIAFLQNKLLLSTKNKGPLRQTTTIEHTRDALGLAPLSQNGREGRLQSMKDRHPPQINDCLAETDPPVVLLSQSTSLPPLVSPLTSTQRHGIKTTNGIAGPPPSRLAPSPPSMAEAMPGESNRTAPELGTMGLARKVFRPLETYLKVALTSSECMNASFSTSRPCHIARATSEASVVTKPSQRSDLLDDLEIPFDAKTLLLGDIGENGMWWTGDRSQQYKNDNDKDKTGTAVDRKTPHIQWSVVNEWYNVIYSCGRSWKRHWRAILAECDELTRSNLSEEQQNNEIEEVMAEARLHVRRTFLKAIENLLRRPGRPLKTPEDCRFLFLLLSNPLLYPNASSSHTHRLWVGNLEQTGKHDPKTDFENVVSAGHRSARKDLMPRGGATGQHSGILKRILGLIANLSGECHQVLVSWFCRFSESQLRQLVELVGGFVTHRLTRHRGRVRSDSHDLIAGLVPNMTGPGAGSSAHLHAALGVGGHSRLAATKANVPYSDDWQIKAAARVMSLLFSANYNGRLLRHEPSEPRNNADNFASRQRPYRHAQLLPTSTFYNTLVDHVDLVSDFETWESRKGRFSFCQYPMFLSIWAKIHIMEYDTRRQMEVKAREAFFDSILTRKAVNQYLVFKVRRDCLVDDSLRSVSEIVGTGQEEIKKGLRIEFLGEEGVDAGGLRKEWFLLLVREVFDPEHGLFVYDEDSHYCYFNPNSFETSDQFFLVGVVLGLAIHNSTILDVALPPLAFRKLLASAPSYSGPLTTATRTIASYTLDDLAEWRPSLAKGLRQLLEYEGNVEETFCRDFVADVERYGEVTQVPLCANGERRPVTNGNRREFVDLYIRFLLDTAVARQYEPFKRGFYTVCGANALSLFRPDEIELLIRGSDEPLDVASLRAVAIYENWGVTSKGNTAPAVSWFWDAFEAADVKDQRYLLSFITGSDRIPAMGATNLVIKIACLGDRQERYPIARTCFNMLGLYRYETKTRLETMLWRAVSDSEGFGLR